MKTFKCVLSLFPAFLAVAFFLCAPAEGSTRAFDDAVEVESPGNSPHGFADSSNRIHAVYIDGESQHQVSSWPGEDFSGGAVTPGLPEPAWHPRVSVSGGNVFALYTFEEGGDYFHRMFRDAGGGFEEVFDGDQEFIGYVGGSDFVHSDVATQDNYVYIIADSNLPIGTAWHIRFSRSDNYGTKGSFAPPDQISSTDGSRYPALAASGANVYAAWVAGGEVRFNRNIDYGDPAKWEVAKTILGSANAENYRPGIAAEGDRVFIVWSDGADVWFSYSEDEGAIFGTPAKVAAADALQTQPSIGVSVSGGEPHLRAAWTETSGGNPRIRFQEAYRNGGVFDWGIDMNADGSISGEDEEGQTIPVGGNGGDESAPTVAVSPAGVVYVVWEDSTSGIMSARYLPEVVPYGPEAPTSLRALPDSGTVSIAWIASTSADVDRYHVYARTDSGASYKYAGAVPEPGTEFLHEGLTDGVTYQYVVTAISSENEESDDSDAVWAVPGTGESGVGTPPSFSPATPAPAPAASSDTPGAGSGCFIATAAYGSAISGEVAALSAFRDGVLLESRAGRAFVSAYYALSPGPAEMIQKNFAAKAIIRLHLFPLIRIINVLN